MKLPFISLSFNFSHFKSFISFNWAKDSPLFMIFIPMGKRGVFPAKESISYSLRSWGLIPKIKEERLWSPNSDFKYFRIFGLSYDSIFFATSFIF